MTRWQFAGYDSDDLAAEYIDDATGEAYYHRYDRAPSGRPTITMNTPASVPITSEPKLLETMAREYGLAPKAFENTLRATVFPRGSNEQLAAFLLVARKYQLNPFTKEIYAIAREEGIAIIVPIDGWLRIINDHPQFDGMELKEDFDDDGELISVTCKIYRKDRSHPMVKTEYMSECAQNTLPWKKWPVRMLAHKATIQCARYAFSLSGIIDPDEAARYIPEEAIAADQPAKLPPVSPPAWKQTAARYKQAEEKRLADPKAQAAEDALREQLKASVELEEYNKRLKADLDRDPIEKQQEPPPEPDEEPHGPAVAPVPRVEEGIPEAYEMGRAAWHKAAKRDQWPARWRHDTKLVEAWQSGWDREEHAGGEAE